MNIALTGGGTAGHIMPNIALKDHLQNHFDNIIYIGSPSGQEKNICQKYGINFYECPSIKFDRNKMQKNFAIPFVLPKCISIAKKILIKNNIDIVFSKGGYVALPVVLACKKLKIPVVCHESDFTLGLSNKICSKFAKATILSFPPQNGILPPNFKLIGNPLRQEIFQANPQSVYHKLNINSNKKIILIVGGSLGSLAIDDCIYNSLDELCQKYIVIHISGKNSKTISHKDYYQTGFVYNIADYLQLADIIIARCGASLSGEITALNKKALYIPLPSKSSRGDQLENANYLVGKGYAQLLLQENLSPITLIEALEKLENFVKKHYNYDKEIPKKIVDLVLAISKNSK